MGSRWGSISYSTWGERDSNVENHEPSCEGLWCVVLVTQITNLLTESRLTFYPWCAVYWSTSHLWSATLPALLSHLKKPHQASLGREMRSVFRRTRVCSFPPHQKLNENHASSNSLDYVRKHTRVIWCEYDLSLIATYLPAVRIVFGLHSRITLNQ